MHGVLKYTPNLLSSSSLPKTSTCSLRSGVRVPGYRWGLICSWSHLLRSSRPAEGEAMISFFFFFSQRIKAVIGACHEIQHLVLFLGHTCRHSGTCPNHRSMQTLLVNPPGMACHEISGPSASHPAAMARQYPIAGTAACPDSGEGGDKKKNPKEKNVVLHNLQSKALSVGERDKCL